MTPEQKGELREILKAADAHFQRLSGADIPQQKDAYTLDEEDRITWKGIVRGLKVLDAAAENHQRIRKAAGHVVDQLEGR